MAHQDNVILQLYSRAHAPNRDYFGLTISQEDVILNTWNITHGPHIFPKKQRCLLEDISYSKSLVAEIQRLFGNHVAEFIIALGKREARLDCLPTKIFLKILRYLATNDILKLGQTSKIFFDLCNRNDVWEIIFKKRNRGAPSRDEVKAATQKKWKTILKNKLVWAKQLQRTNKDKTTIEIKPKPKDSNKRVTSAKKQSESKTSLITKKLGVKVPELEKFQQTEIKTKSIFTTKELEDAVNLLESSKFKQNDAKPRSQSKRDVSLLNSSKIQEINLKKVTEIPPSGKGLPLKGILKRSSEDISKKVSVMDPIYESGEPRISKIDYRPLSKTKLTVPTKNPLTSISNSDVTKGSITSLLSEVLTKDKKKYSTSDRHLDRFLDKLDQKATTNPFKLDPKLFEVPSNITRIKSSSTLTKRPSVSTVSKQSAIKNSSVSKSVNDKLKMPSKFDDYLNSTRGVYVHPDVEFEIRKDAGKTTFKKADLIPKISELGKSINNIRSSFYNGDKYKLKMNNSKITNQEQQLNNKLNTTIASTSLLDIKKNGIKTFEKVPAGLTTVKEKNTNCAPPVNKYSKGSLSSLSKKTAKK